MSTASSEEVAEEVYSFAGRFVILTHDNPFLHWDLMLESEGVLRTWRLLAEPEPDVVIGAEPLPDHRLAYLDYEGPVSEERGTVEQWDRGLHQTRQTPQRIVSTISGQRLGLCRIVISPEGPADPWTFYLRRSVPANSP